MNYIKILKDLHKTNVYLINQRYHWIWDRHQIRSRWESKTERQRACYATIVSYIKLITIRQKYRMSIVSVSDSIVRLEFKWEPVTFNRMTEWAYISFLRQKSTIFPINKLYICVCCSTKTFTFNGQPLGWLLNHQPKKFLAVKPVI